MVHKILMVEDEQRLVDVVQGHLSKSRFEMYRAIDGLEGFQIAKAKTPDLIITDASIPVINGFEFCKAIKHDEDTKFIPIIVLVLKSNMEDSFMFLGIKDFLSKPISLDKLQEIIDHKLDWTKMMHVQRTKVLIHSSRAEVLTQAQELLPQVPQWIGYYANNKRTLLEESAKHAPDVIVLDLMMQDVPADDMVRELKAMPGLEHTTILTYYTPTSTSRDPLSMQAQLIEVQFLKSVTHAAGAYEYLGPFNSSRFLNLINIYRKDFDA